MPKMNKCAALFAVACAAMLVSPAFAKPQAGQKPVVDCSKIRGVCHSCGYKSMPILFNGNGLDPKSIQPEAYAAADRFTEAIVKALKEEPGLLMFDMMNEPLCNPWMSNATGDVRKVRAETTWAFLRREIDVARKSAYSLALRLKEVCQIVDD